MSRVQASGIPALLRDYRRFAGGKLWLALALMLAGALAEGFGLLMIVPLATIAIDGGGADILRFAPWAASLSTDQRLMAALGLFVGAMAARSLLLFARDTLLARIASEYEASLRFRSAATLALRGWPYASRIGQAGMQSLLLNNVPRAGFAAGYAQTIAVGVTMLAVQLAVTFLLSPALTLVAVAFLAAAAVMSSRFALRGMRSGVAISDTMESSTDSGFRLHAELKAALAQATVPAFLAEYRSSLGHAAGQVTRFGRDLNLAHQIAVFGAALVAAILLLVGVRVLALPFPILVASLVLFSRMSAPAQLLQNSLLRLGAYAPAFAAIERRLGTLIWSAPEQRLRARIDWSALELENVAFEHQPGLGISRVSMHLQRGQWLGLSGPSGAGKTTLVDLVAGLHAPQNGTIAVDGQALQGDVLEAWRAGIAYVGQEGSVFNDTVRGNLLADGVTADEQDLWQALEASGLADRVRAFSGGLEESVGDRGSQLSGGERQRLLLARALLRRPTLLILDEASAALDPQSEAAVLRRLKAIEPRPAALIVAHRDSTLTHCDRVVSIQHGVVSAGDQSICVGETT